MKFIWKHLATRVWMIVSAILLVLVIAINAGSAHLAKKLTANGQG